MHRQISGGLGREEMDLGFERLSLHLAPLSQTLGTGEQSDGNLTDLRNRLPNLRANSNFQLCNSRKKASLLYWTVKFQSLLFIE
jgi:hypothetical protein